MEPHYNISMEDGTFKLAFEVFSTDKVINEKIDRIVSSTFMLSKTQVNEKF
jgi:hypothetical protein